MAMFNGKRFPPDNCNRNFQWNPCDMNSAGNGHCMPPFQIPPTPTFRPPQPEGFAQSNVQIRPPISNFPESVNPPGFRYMLPPQNQTFPTNVSTSQNFFRTSDSQNFPTEPTSQNFSRVPDSQNFSMVADPANFTRAPDSQNFPRTTDLQNFARTPDLQNFPRAPEQQNVAGNLSSQDSFKTPNSQNFPRTPYSQNFPAPHNFPSVPYPQNFPRVPNSQNFPRAPDPQNFPRAPDPHNFPRASDPHNFPRVPNFCRTPDSQNFPRVPGPQNFPRAPGPQNFPGAHSSQNFSKAPDSHYFPRAHGPQNFPSTPSPQNFPSTPSLQNFPSTPSPQNFPSTPSPQNFPGTSGSQHFPGALGSQNFQRAHGIQNFPRTPSPQNFPGASDLQHSTTAPDSRKFTRSPGFQNFPSSSGSQNFSRETNFQNFSRARGSFQQSFRPWNRSSSFGGQRPQFQSQTQRPAPSQQLGGFSSQENKRGIPKDRYFMKLKEDSREKPFSCDTCDRAFATENELKDHFSQHIKCDHANCTFEAHHKIVALHKKMQHDTGYADRINKLKDAAEIEKWREERKRRFPTAETVKKRKAEQAEREARGEVLETKEFGKFKRKREDSGNAMNKNAYRKRSRRFKKFNDRRRNFTPRLQSFEINVDSESDSDSDSHITLHRFPGMLSTNSAEKITDKIEEMESTSGPQIDQTPIAYEHQLPQISPKPQFDSNFSHLKVPYSDSNSNNQDKDKETLKSNDDKQSGVVNETTCETLTDNLEEKSKELFQVEDSDDEGPIAIPVVKCSEKSPIFNQDINQKDAVNKCICEIPVEKSEEKNVDLVHVADSDEDGPIVTPILKSSENFPFVDKNLDQNKDNSKIVSGSNTQTKTYENGHNSNNNRYNRYSRNRYNQPNGQDCIQIARKSSLLEKLLADDIRHERNVILQCIRHIVKNNFFGIEKKCLK